MISFKLNSRKSKTDLYRKQISGGLGLGVGDYLQRAHGSFLGHYNLLYVDCDSDYIVYVFVKTH